MNEQNNNQNARVFDYASLCREQAISVEIPQGTIVTLSEADELVDLVLKTVRLFNRVDRIRAICMAELQFAKANNNMIRGAEFTGKISSETNDAFKYLDSPAGLMQTYKKLMAREISAGYTSVRMLISTPLNIVYTQLKGILVQVINLDATYQKYGSENGCLPFLTLEGATSVLEKTIHMENYLYDALYVLGTVLLTSLSSVHGKDTPKVLKDKLKNYELFENEGDRALSRVMTSFKPEARFVLSEGEDIIYNF